MKNNRRKFLTDLGKLSGVLLFSGEILETLPALAGGDQDFGETFKKKNVRVPIDFRYAPSSWQTTYSFPVDGKISLIDKYGALLLDHPGTGNAIDAFGVKIVLGLTGEGAGEFIEQKLESPEIPIITTRMKYGSIEVKITSFASRFGEEGRVDNHLFEIVAGDGIAAGRQPAIIIKSAKKFEHKSIDVPELERKQAAIVTSIGEENSILCLVDGPVELLAKGKEQVFALSAGNEIDKKTLRYFVRIPRENQTVDALKAGLKMEEEILANVRSFWQTLVPPEKSNKLIVHSEYEPFLSASIRNILQVSEMGPKKRLFHSGPTFIKDMYPAEAVFIIEALRAMGYDKEAQEGLETIWNMQDTNGAFTGSAGPHSLKDTAAAVYALARNADLTQDFDYFNELFPDSVKAIAYIQDLRYNEYSAGKTQNGKYQILPRGPVETGVDGDRAELTNTLWTIMAIRQAVAVANKFFLPGRTDMRDFMAELIQALLVISDREMKTHPQGFKYLSMLLPDDPLMKSKDKSKRPVPQFAQYALTKALFPGLIYRSDHKVIAGHLALMNSILQEDVPVGTGILGKDAVETYHAAALAQFYIWMGQPDQAVRIFRGFLNHASPLYGWRGEQSLLSSKEKLFAGDMPHALAAAECILFLRNSLVLEELDKLRLLDGLVPEDFAENKPITMTDTPTRWGKITILLEPVDARSWKFTFKRSGFQGKYNPKLEMIEFPRRLTQKLQLDKIPECKYQLQGSRVQVDPSQTEWVAMYRIFGK